MFKGKGKTIGIFLVCIVIMAALIFIPQRGNERNKDKESTIKTTTEVEEFTYEEGLTDEEKRAQEDDLKHKEAWCYYGDDNTYEELWLFKNDEYAYSLWVGDVEERIVSGHYKRSGNKLVYWIDDKEVRGEYKDGKLIIDDKVFTEFRNGG